MLATFFAIIFIIHGVLGQLGCWIVYGRGNRELAWRLEVLSVLYFIAATLLLK